MNLLGRLWNNYVEALEICTSECEEAIYYIERDDNDGLFRNRF